MDEIVRGQRAITPDTALRLARYFGTSSGFWLGLQLDYDLEETERSVGAEIRPEVAPRFPYLRSRQGARVSRAFQGMTNRHAHIGICLDQCRLAIASTSA